MLLTLLLALTLIPASSFMVFADDPPQVRITVGSATVSEDGGTVEVPVSIADNIEIGTLGLQFTYNTSVLTLTAFGNSVLTDAVENPAAGLILYTNPDGFRGNGLLFNLVFSVSPGSNASSYPIGVSLIAGQPNNLTDLRGNSIIPTFVPGSVEINESADPPYDFAAVKALIRNAPYGVEQTEANSQGALGSWLPGYIRSLLGSGFPGVGFSVENLTVSPAIGGTSGDPDGTNGSFGFTVRLTHGKESDSVAGLTGEIIATRYARASISLGNPSETSIFPGTTFTIPVIIDGNPGFCGLSLEVDYDTSALRLMGFKYGASTLFGAAPGQVSPHPDTGVIQYTSVSESGKVSANGVLFELEFEALAGALPAGESSRNWSISVDLTGGDPDNFIDANLAALSYPAFAGQSITVTKAVPSYTVPTGLTAIYGQTLADVALPSATNGVWSWNTPTASVGSVGEQQHLATFTSNDTKYQPVTDILVTIEVGKATPGVATPTGLTAVYGQTLADVGLPAGWSWTEPATTPVGNAGARNHPVRFTPDDPDNYKTIDATVSIEVAKANPAYTVPTGLTATYGQTLANVELSGGWSWVEATTTPVGNAGTQNHPVRFTPADPANYNSIEASAAIQVAKAIPSYTVPTNLTATYGQTLADVELSGGWSWVEATTTPVGGAGTRTHSATFTSADINYQSVTETLTIQVAKATPVYTAPTGLTATYGDTLADVELSGGWSWVTPAALVGSAGWQVHSIRFIPEDAANYNTINATVGIQVAKGTPTYTIPTGLTATYGQTLDKVTLPDGWSWDAPVTTPVGAVGSQAHSATFTPDDTANYNTVPGVSLYILVGTTYPPYTIPTNLTAIYGQTLADVALSGGWSWDAPATTPVGNAGTRTHRATFTSADINYQPVTETLTIEVAKATPDYTVPTGLTAIYGQTLTSVELPDGWSWDAPAITLVGNAGTQSHDAHFTPEDTANYTSIDATVNIEVAKATPAYIAPTNLTATYGQTLANVELSGGWSWDEATTTSVGAVGSQPHSATFTPADTNNYNTVPGVSLYILVNTAIPPYTIPTNLTATYGQTLASVALLPGWSWDEGTATPVGDAGTRTHRATFTPTNTNYHSVTETLTIQVAKATPDYTVPTGRTATYGDTLSSVTLPTGWSWVEAATTTLVGNAGTQSHDAHFTPEDTANYTTVDTTVNIEVAKATPTYTIPTGLTATYGQTLADVDLPDGWSWDAPDTTPVGSAGSQLHRATFTPDDTDNYNTVPGVSLYIQVDTTLPPYTVPTGLTATYGQTLAEVELPGGWSWDAPATTPVGDAGARSHSATFTSADTSHQPVTETLTIEVAKAAPDYIAPTNLTAIYGQTLADVKLPDGWSWDEATTSVGVVGSQPHSATFTPDDTNNYNTVSGVLLYILVNTAIPPYTIPTNLTATYGQTLASVALLPGWSWDEGTATLVGDAGTRTHSATFTLTNPNYQPVTETLTIQVAKATPDHTVPTGLVATYGDTLAGVELSGGWSWVAPADTPVGSAGTQVHFIRFIPTDPDNYNTIEAAVGIEVAKATPDVATPAGLTAVYGQTLASVTLSGGWSWIEATSTPVGNVGTQSHDVLFTPADPDNYNSIEASAAIQVAKAIPSYTVPTGLVATYGQTLVNVVLPAGWSWAEPVTTPVGDAGTQSHSATFTSADTNYQSVTETLTIQVAKAIPSYTVPTGLTATYGDILASVALPAGWSWVEAATTTSVGDAGTQSHDVRFTPADVANYSTINATVGIEVAKATPTYTIPTGLTAAYGQTLASVALPDGWSWDAPATTPVGSAGSQRHSATFTPDDTANYNTVPGVSLYILVGTTFPPYTVPTGLTATYGDTLASVTLPTGWSWSAPATTPVGNAGMRSHSATFIPADTNYQPVTETLTIEVAKATPDYTVPTGLTAVYGQTLTSVALPDGWSWDAPAITLVGNAGTQSHDAHFTPADTANYTSIDATVNIEVAKATPAYTVPTNLTATYGQTLANVTLSGGWSWDEVTTTSVGAVGSQPHSATFTPADTANYNIVPGVSLYILVNTAIPPYTIPTNLVATYGQTLASVALLPGWSWDEGTATPVGDAGTRTHRATFTPTNTNYQPVTETLTIQVLKATPLYTVPTGLVATYGDTLADVALLDGWSWVAPADTPVGSAGTQAHSIRFIPEDAANYNTVDATVSIQVAKAAPDAATPTNLTATYGQTLASVALPVGWSWVEAADTPVGNAGARNHPVRFTPADTANYNTVDTTATIQVAKAIPSYTVPTNLTAIYGQTLASVTLPAGWSWVEAATTPVGDAGTRNHVIRFTSTDPDNFEVIEVVLAISVAKAPLLTIAFPQAGSITFGQTLGSVPLFGGSVQYGSFVWAESPAIQPPVGFNEYTLVFVPNDSTRNNYELADSYEQSVVVLVNQAPPTTTTTTTTPTTTTTTVTSPTTTVTPPDTPLAGSNTPGTQTNPPTTGGGNSATIGDDDIPLAGAVAPDVSDAANGLVIWPWLLAALMVICALIIFFLFWKRHQRVRAGAQEFYPHE